MPVRGGDVYVLELAGEDDDFAAREAGAAVPEGTATVQGPGIATADSLDHERVHWLALTHHASAALARTAANVDAATAVLRSAPIDRTGTVAVRARDVRSSAGIDTQATERALGAVLSERGFGIDLEDPDHELRAVFAGAPVAQETDGGAGSTPDSTTSVGSARDDAGMGGSNEEPAGAKMPPAAGTDGPADGVGFLGWHVASSQRDFGDRQPTDRPFFQPGSMDPLLARAVVNLAGAGPGVTVCDPLCGTGGLLLEAGLVGADLIGLDVQRQMVTGTRENLAAASFEPSCETPPAEITLAQADASRLPLVADVADTVVFDAPYGRQSKIAGRSADRLLTDVLEDSARVAPRAVVVADRPLAATLSDSPWTVAWRHEQRVHRSLVRHVHGLGR